MGNLPVYVPLTDLTETKNFIFILILNVRLFGEEEEALGKASLTEIILFRGGGGMYR